MSTTTHPIQTAPSDVPALVARARAHGHFLVRVHQCGRAWCAGCTIYVQCPGCGEWML